MPDYQTIDQYLKLYPKEVVEKLQTLRKLIKEIAPEAIEIISYGVPTFKLNGTYLIYIAGFKNHISIYPTSDAMIKELPSLAKYRTGKGTLQFPLDKALPLPLIKKVIKFRLKENIARTKK